MPWYILPKDPSVNVAPSGRRYITSTHYVSLTTKLKKTVEKLFIRKHNDITNQRTLTNDLNNQLTTLVFDSSTTDRIDTIITVRHKNKLKMRNIGQIIVPTLSMFGKAVDEL